MDAVSFLLVAVILTALAFDFTNGFHDTANSMATSIATGALSPRVAVAVAGVLNLAGAFLSTEVAKTISGGIVENSEVSLVMIFAGLIGAILWNLVTWLLGLPSSSSHALFGGLIGAVWVGAGGSAVRFGAIIEKIVIPAVASPAGGWRIIRTMGKQLTDIQAPQGFAAETSATAVILASSHMGFALSTTQVCTGSILGAGLGRKLAHVRWGVAGRIAVSWLLTLPAAAAVGGVAAWVADQGDLGVALVAVVAIAAAAAFYVLSRRRPVSPENVNEVPAPEPAPTVKPAA